jgi:hypothetical protein
MENLCIEIPAVPSEIGIVERYQYEYRERGAIERKEGQSLVSRSPTVIFVASFRARALGLSQTRRTEPSNASQFHRLDQFNRCP